MHNRLVPALITMAIVCSIPSTARADTDRTSDPRVRTSLTIAAQYWNAQPACERVSVWASPTLTSDGEAYLGGCDMWIPADRFEPIRATYDGAGYDMNVSWSYVCDTIVHEWGHLLGYRHDASIAPVMVPRRNARIQQCVDAFLPLPKWARGPRARRLYQSGELELARASARTFSRPGSKQTRSLS